MVGYQVTVHFNYDHCPNPFPFTPGSISLLSCSSAIDTGVEIRDGSGRVICDMEVGNRLDYCYIVGGSETKTVIVCCLQDKVACFTRPHYNANINKSIVGYTQG